MENLILDTSVLVKLFSSDERDYIADNLLERYSQNKLDLITLDLGVYELTNTLKLSKKASVSTVFKNVYFVLKMKKIVKISAELIQHSLLFMDQFSLTAYDAAFIAAAEIEHIPLLTADYKHHRKNISKQILHYEEFRLK